MSESTQEMLTKQVDGTAETVREYARQIESGEYGNRWTVTDDAAEEITDWVVIADTEDAALDAAIQAGANPEQYSDLTAERDEFDEPTICDERGNESSIDEWPLAVEVKIGRPLSVLITAGGPHIEIVQDLSDGSAKLAGYWGGERVYRHGPEFQTVLDYFTDMLWDEAPEEYK